jgi:NAD(P)H-dependent FMN reductase
MAQAIGLSGSLRKGSFNTSLLRAAAELAPDELAIDVRSIAGIPLYDGDLERERGLPKPVEELKTAIAAADALLLVTPEYNGSIPGVFKNAIDWLSRPPKDIDRVFGGKPVAIMGATPGRAGTRLSQTAFLPIARALGMQPWFGNQLYVAGAGDVFDASGVLVDDKIRELLDGFMAGFAGYVAQSNRRLRA